jgi:hypothetical protein
MPKRNRRVSRLLAAVIPALLVSIAIGAPAGAYETSDADVVVAGPAAQQPPLGDPVLCPVEDLQVPEAVGSGVVTEWLQYGETFGVGAYDDRIWAGVWFTPWNGPEGWVGTSAPSNYPLPGAPKYSLIARFGDGPYEYLGSSGRSFTNDRPGYQMRVRFRVNDDYPGNGDGAFKVQVAWPCH